MPKIQGHHCVGSQSAGSKVEEGARVVRTFEPRSQEAYTDETTDIVANHPIALNCGKSPRLRERSQYLISRPPSRRAVFSRNRVRQNPQHRRTAGQSDMVSGNHQMMAMREQMMKGMKGMDDLACSEG